MRIIFFFILLWSLVISPSNSLCSSCLSNLFRSCYHCRNAFPRDRSHVEQVSIDCTSNQSILSNNERFYSIIKSYSTKDCPMKIFYLDQFTLWNYLESLSITYAHLTHLSPVIFNRSLSFSPVLYSIKTLNLSHNSLPLLQKNFSYYFPSLERLDLSYNRLILIRKRALSHFLHLKELYLHHNHLKDISSIILPRQSIRLINLQANHWHCSCANVLTLSISRPIPSCRTPIEYRNANAGDIARQCFLRTKAVIALTTDDFYSQNLTCALSSTIDVWKNKTNSNVTLLSAWHLEQHRPIAIDYLYDLSQKSEKYLICFNLNSSRLEAIQTIIPLTLKASSMNTTSKPSVLVVQSARRLPAFFHWLLKTSKYLLPQFLQTSEKQVLIIWLILLLVAFAIFTFLIYLIHRQHRTQGNYQVNASSDHPFVRFDRDPHDHHTIFNLRFNCVDHKCLCQFRRKTHSTLYLTKSKSIILSNLELNKATRPRLIQPTELRYAKIKQITSMKDLNHHYLAGQFRTIVKFKSLPN